MMGTGWLLSLYVGPGVRFIVFVHVVLKWGDASPSVGKECLVLPYFKNIGFASAHALCLVLSLAGRFAKQWSHGLFGERSRVDDKGIRWSCHPV